MCGEKHVRIALVQYPVLVACQLDRVRIDKNNLFFWYEAFGHASLRKVPERSLGLGVPPDVNLVCPDNVVLVISDDTKSDRIFLVRIPERATNFGAVCLKRPNVIENVLLFTFGKFSDGADDIDFQTIQFFAQCEPRFL